MHRVVLNFLRAGFLLLIFTSGFAQINYEKGYIVNQEGERIECLILNVDWLHNPTEIKYKMDESGGVLSGSPLTLKEFGVLGGAKFISALVKIDTSGVFTGTMSQTRYPEWTEETVFLKEIVNGTASLYYFSNQRYKRFFFNVKNGPINQLVYKEYSIDSRTFSTNNDYMQQLWNEVKCSDTRIDQVKSLRYLEPELKSYFKKFNKCSGDVDDVAANSVDTKKRDRDVLNLKFAIGLNSANASISNSAYSIENAELRGKSDLRLGLEAEFVLPFNSNKWSVLFEPTYQSFNAEGESTFYHYKVSYKFFDLPIGLRYYSFIDEKIKLFFNAHFNPTLLGSSGDKIQRTIKGYSGPGDEIEMKIKFGGYALGVGFEVFRFSGEVRYYSAMDLTSQYVYREVLYKRLSVIFGYKFVKLKN